MRMSRVVGRTIKENPRDAELASHRYLVRAGFVRQFSTGIYALLPLAKRSIAKIENIIREEMNAIDGQEILMPCMMTRELWEESGRYGAIGKDMFRLKDRNEKDMVLGMTHEEPVVAIARTELTSYRQLPAMMYQIQSKFRDEPRPRGGLIRVREFTMKDAYSFHTSEECLKAYYDKAYRAYWRIFRRAGCRSLAAVLSDNGMFGGRFSHEFMLLVPTGEDTIITCGGCSYKANREVATSPIPTKRSEELPLEKVHTPHSRTIEEVAGFLKMTAADTCKAVLYQTRQGRLVAAFVRGDHDVVEQKLKGVVQEAVEIASPEVLRAAGCEPGFAGPMGLNLKNALVVLDPTVVGSTNLVTGANEDEYHYKNFNVERDFLSKLSEAEKSSVRVGDIAAVQAGDPCPECGAELQETRGIEVGNIFHLGTRYSASMGCAYLDQNGKSHAPIMGCYGIGVGRMLASVAEESHDDYGMILPITIAPFEIHLNVLNAKEAGVMEAAEKLYGDLRAAGIDVLMDDRDEKPGSQFADADLIGIPLRVILSPKTLARGEVEFKFRDKREPARFVPLAEAVEFLRNTRAAEYDRYRKVADEETGSAFSS